MPEPAEKTIQILLIDDHALFRESVSRLLRPNPDSKLWRIVEPSTKRCSF